MKFGINKRGKKKSVLLDFLFIIAFTLMSSYAFAQITLMKVWTADRQLSNSPEAYTLFPVQHNLNGTLHTHVLTGSFPRTISNFFNATHVDIDMWSGWDGSHVWKSRQYNAIKVDHLRMTDDDNGDGIKDVHVRLKNKGPIGDSLKILSGANGQEITSVILNGTNITNENNPTTYEEVQVFNSLKAIYLLEDGNLSGYIK